MVAHGAYSASHAADIEERVRLLRALPRPGAVRLRADASGPLPPGGKRVHFIRHGEGVHNVAQREWLLADKGVPYTLANDPSYTYLDAQLTDTGEGQARALQPRARELAPGVLIVSPMRRAIRTALLAFDEAIAAGLPVLAHEGCHEMGGLHTCDRRLSRTELAAAYGAVDFSLIAEEDPMWGDGSTRESLEACAARGAEFVRWLMARPEAEIAVACHSTFLLALFNGALAADGDVEALCAHFGTGEMRTVVLAPSAS